MPTYFCTTAKDRLTSEQKSKIAGDITRIHLASGCGQDFAPKERLHHAISNVEDQAHG